MAREESPAPWNGSGLSEWKGPQMAYLESERRCTVEGCSRGHKSQGYCDMHYQRWRSHGDPQVVGRRPPTYVGCSVDGCKGKHLSIGLCSKHHQRLRAHGDPTVTLPRRHEFVKNPAVHWRLRKDQGPASSFPCQHCGQAADNWAYDHGEPNPLMDEEGPYSLDPARYMPLCFSCHTTFDKGMKVGAR